MRLILDLHDRVHVKLTKRGKKIYSKYAQRYFIKKNLYAKPAADGHLELDLWELMYIFGNECVMGPQTPFKKNEIIITKEN